MRIVQGDNRYSSDAAIITHDRTELKAKSVFRLSEAENAAYSYDVIGIDEGQFFPGMSLLGPLTHACMSFLYASCASITDSACCLSVASTSESMLSQP